VFTDHLPAPDEAVEAERLGFHRVFLSERHNVKNAGVSLGRPRPGHQRIGLASGAMATSARTPIVNAALAATVNAVCGGRASVLGLGRGTRQLYAGHGFPEGGEVGYQHLDRPRHDHPSALARRDRELQRPRRPVRGPANERPSAARTADLVRQLRWPEGVPGCRKPGCSPGIFYRTCFTATATAKSVGWTRQECKPHRPRPGSVHICQCVITAPDCDEREMKALVHARMALSPALRRHR